MIHVVIICMGQPISQPTVISLFGHLLFMATCVDGDSVTLCHCHLFTDTFTFLISELTKISRRRGDDGGAGEQAVVSRISFWLVIRVK